jgi:hypothetical protein
MKKRALSIMNHFFLFQASYAVTKSTALAPALITLTSYFSMGFKARRISSESVWLSKVFVVVQQTRVRTSMIPRAAYMTEFDKDVF